MILIKQLINCTCGVYEFTQKDLNDETNYKSSIKMMMIFLNKLMIRLIKKYDQFYEKK